MRDLTREGALNPSVSVIIPAYNEEAYIGGAIQSIQKIDYPKDRVEVIVVDNESTDRTRQIAEKNKARVIQFPKQSIGASRNFGAKHAMGEVLVFLDSDCLVPKNWLIGMIHYFSDQNVVCVGPGIAPPKGPTSWTVEVWHHIEKNRFNSGYVNTISSFNFVVKKDLFEKIGGFNETLVTGEDSDLGYRLSEHGKLMYAADVIVIHLRNAATLKAFFLKELWRGQGNIKSFFAHRVSLSELPGVVVPAIYLLLLLALPVLAFFLSSEYRYLGFGFIGFSLLFFPGLMTIRTCSAAGKTTLISKIFLYHTVHLLAKATSLFVHVKRK